jgi:predicted Rossmann-fold nucleotide-binding protein
MQKPFTLFPSELYSAATLYRGYDPEREESFKECYDTQVYTHYVASGKQARDIGETLARSLHDHSISDALHDVLARYDERAVVAVMGGHALSREDGGYAEVARLAKRLTEQGKLMVSGGGPGAMEATHLGAWMAGRKDEELDKAIEILSAAPRFEDRGWLALAFEVMRRYPRDERYCSIGIPTWFYGHEPATPFASHIAKYFDNSVREDGLLAIAKGGVVYSPGSAGTMQEVFQDAAQNHYKTFGFASPMVFLGREHWTRTMPVYPLLESLQEEGKYRNLLLSIVDTAEEAVSEILEFK